MPLHRPIFGLLRLAVGILPVGLIVFRSAAYVSGCLSVLSSPGVPIRWPIKSPKGDLILEADSYSVQLPTGNVILRRPKLTSPDGRLLARLDAVNAKIDWNIGGVQKVQVTLSRMNGLLVRDADGKFELAQYLSSQKSQSKGVPFEIIVRNASIDFVDRSIKGNQRRYLRMPLLKVSGNGGDWVASTALDVERVGVLNLNLQHTSTNEISAALNISAVQVAEISRSYERDSPLPGWFKTITYDRMKLTGPVDAFIGATGDRHWKVPIDLVAENVRWKQFYGRSLAFRGNVTENGLDGTFVAKNPGLTAEFACGLKWGAKLTGEGRTRLSVEDRNSLPAVISDTFSKSILFRNLRADGHLDITIEGPQWTGIASATEAGTTADHVIAPQLELAYAKDRIQFSVKSANVLGISATGIGTLDFKSKRVSADIRTASGSLKGIVDRFKLTGVDAIGAIQASVQGRIDDPQIFVDVKGSANYVAANRQQFDLGEFVASGEYQSQGFRVNQAWIKGPSGLLTASGKLSPKRDLSFEVVGRNIPTTLIQKDLIGTSNLRAIITGTLDEPHALGLAEAYAVTYAEKVVPAIRANFEVDRGQVSFNGFHAIRGTASIEGEAAYEFRSGSLRGKFKGTRLRLAELFGDAITGSIDVPSVTLGGTLAKPNVVAEITGKRAVLDGVKVSDFSGTFVFNGESVDLSDGNLTIAQGTVNVNGEYFPERKSGSITALAKGLKLDELAPEVAEDFTLGGTGTAKLDLEIENNEIRHAASSGKLRDVALNGVLLGNGSFSGNFANDIVKGSLQVGQLARYTKLSDASYDLKSGGFAADVAGLNIRLENVLQASRRYIDSLSVENRQMIGRLAASMNFDAHVERTNSASSVDVNLRSLEVADVKYQDQVLGNLVAVGSKRGKKWNVPTARLSGPLGEVVVNGVAEEGGNLAVSGDVSKVPLAQLKEFEPRLAQLSGTLDQFSFVAIGSVKSPEIKASASVSGLLARPDAKDDESLRISLDQISVSEKSGIDVDGHYFYRGFAGQVAATLPIEYPFNIPRKGATKGHIALDPRDFHEIALLLPSLNAAHTSGVVSGDLRFAGSVEDPIFDGQIELRDGAKNGKVLPSTIGFVGIDQTLQSVRTKVDVKANKLSVDATASVGANGTAQVHLEIPSQQIQTLIDQVESGEFEYFASLPVSGKATLENIPVKQNIPKDKVTPAELATAIRNYVTSPGSIQASVDSNVTIEGTVTAPRVSGNVDVSNLDCSVPAFQPARSTNAQPKFDPSFNIAVRLQTPGRFRASTADLTLIGAGTVNGKLSSPKVETKLDVTEGSFRMPGGLIRIDPNSTVEIAIGTGAAPRLSINLDGHTAITAVRYGDQIERFDISIEIQGDLLSEQPLVFTPSSDPPGLDKDRIIGILAQTNLISELGNSNTRGDAERRFRDALAGYALPSALDSFTRSVASSLGLEYVNLEYNTYDQASVLFGKAFGNGFSFQGSRQLSQPPPGFVQRYDYRLIYRPRGKQAERFRFSIGADEQRPWKIAIEYGFRF